LGSEDLFHKRKALSKEKSERSRSSTKPYQPTDTKSTGDQVIDDLKQYLPDYKKTQTGIFKLTCDDGSLQNLKS
jgi:hypothetical protein